MASFLGAKVVGQTTSIDAIVPHLQMYQAGLSPDGRPAGVFLLLGPTGTGKTRTVEAVAELLHGNPKCILKVDCGEFQMEHEVAKLIGAPPGYLGHRETQPMLNQMKLNAATSERSNLSVVLFDEIEKAATSMARLLLGVLDKGTLRLGDNSTVNFEKTLIFFTSNLGAREMARHLRPDFGFEALVAGPGSKRKASGKRLDEIALRAAKRRFSPEFINRLDSIMTYQPLDHGSLEAILDLQIQDFQRLVRVRLGARAFIVDVPPESRRFLLRKGTSAEYGARELKRAIHRFVIQPVAALVSSGEIPPQSRVSLHPKGESALTVRVTDGLRIVSKDDRGAGEAR